MKGLIGGLVFGLILLMGAFMLLLGVAGYVMKDNPLVALLPGIGPSLDWVATNFTVLMGGGIFLAAYGASRSLPLALIMTIGVMAGLYVTGVIK